MKYYTVRFTKNVLPDFVVGLSKYTPIKHETNRPSNYTLADQFQSCVVVPSCTTVTAYRHVLSLSRNNLGSNLMVLNHKLYVNVFLHLYLRRPMTTTD